MSVGKKSPAQRQREAASSGRDYKRESDLKAASPKRLAKQAELQRARRAVDKRDTGSVTKLKNGKRVASTSPKRKGKDVSHKKALSKGGKNSDGITIESRSKNRARNYKKKK